jgi:hypothetical protein
MFRKIVSNLPFSPALVGQLGFYAKRLRKEEATRRIGLIFTALALVVQGFAVFTPPESANAANGNDIIYGGFKSKNELLEIYDRNRDSAGHKDLQQIYTYYGITRQDIVNAKWTTFNSQDQGNKIQSIGRSTVSFQSTPRKITGTSTTIYERQLSKFDTTDWSKRNGTTYQAIVGKRAIDGQWFAIIAACGNAAVVNLPPAPKAACSSLTITPISRTKFRFNAKASTSSGATITSYTYTLKDDTSKTVHTAKQSSSATTNAIEYDFTQDGSYVAEVVVSTSIGDKAGGDCTQSLTVSPEPRCPLNPDLVESSPDCKPCEDNPDIWYKDENCRSEFELTKKISNTSQLITDANNTTASSGDRLEYRLSVKNVGAATGTYTIEDNLSDVLDYANIVDTGGGTLLQQDDSTPIERVGTITWPAIEIAPGETITKIVSVQVKSSIPATPQNTGNPESYDCKMVNTFAGNETVANINCPSAKVVEQVVGELPKTGPGENMLFAGILLAVVVYFYARSRQQKKEIRLIRRDLNTGLIG